MHEQRLCKLEKETAVSTALGSPLPRLEPADVVAPPRKLQLGDVF